MNQPEEKQQINEQKGPINYGAHEYWDKRYLKTSGARFDWLENYQTLKFEIEKYLKDDKDSVILNVGCGNGEIQDLLYEAGYHKIFNNDISSVVIEQMSKIKQSKKQEQMVYEIMDACSMTYADQMFDLVLDKSTIDALLCSDTPVISVAQMLEQVYRVLKPNGIYLVVSYGSPTTRMEHLVREHIKFQIEVKQLSKKSQNNQYLTHYIYVCRKLQMQKYTEEWRKEYYARLKKIEIQEYC